jgi:hypothetical protein
MCGKPAQDAHHLLERRLWLDGGYYLDNGVSLCAGHHLSAEATLISVDDLRRMAGIKHVLLPEFFDDEAEYDKWGNMVWPDKSRSKGPLFGDESVQKVLKPVLSLFRPYYKHARTPHLPWSPNRGVDSDKTMGRMAYEEGLFLKIPEIVLTLKMDGEQISMYHDIYHARSMESGYHPSRSWVGGLHGRIRHEIPENVRIVGENLYAAHSIRYFDLPSYFLVFAIFENNVAYSWTDTKDFAALLGLETVPELYRGIYDRKMLERFWPEPMYSEEAEGYVLRPAAAFDYMTWPMWVGKAVRKDHVKTDQHWRYKPLEKNGLTSA